MALAARFPRYTAYDPPVPVVCLTPDLDGCFHRFFDTSPLSPSGRWLAVTRLAAEDRLPRPGDVAQVVLVDLTTGQHRVVAETRAADTQLGAQVQWGVTDHELWLNDLDPGDWQPFSVQLDPLSGARRTFDGPVYMVSPDGRQLASPCLLRTGLTQAGYGVIAPEAVVPRNRGAASDDGLWVTAVDTGRSRLLLSFADLVAALGDRLDDPAQGDFYGFHVKWSPDGTRLMFVVRWVPHGGGANRPALVTCRADGSDLRLALPATPWARGGHHPDWCPDSVHWTMNLKLDDQLRFVQARYDGTELHALHPALRGSGHPSLHPDGRHLVTDAYPLEPVACGDGDVPIRGIDLATGVETCLCRIPSVPPFVGPRRELRVDPHPAWDRTRRYLVFNGCPAGTRRVYLADLGDWLAGGGAAGDPC